MFEVAKAAELISDATRRILATGSIQKPVISSACPAVTRLIRVRFPELIEHVLPLVPPVELAARMARRESNAAHRAAGRKDRLHCAGALPGQGDRAAYPIGSSHSEIDRSVAIKDVYPALLAAMSHVERPEHSGRGGEHRPGLGREAAVRPRGW